MPRNSLSLIQSLDDRRAALLDELDTLSAEVLEAKPGPGIWSILEIVEHVVVAESVILQGLPQLSDWVGHPRRLEHRIKFLVVWLVLKWRVPVQVPSRRMLPTGQRSLAELRATWDAHLRWLRACAEAAGREALERACFTHPVAGPITLAQALRMDLLHLETHRRQIAKRQAAALHAKA